MDLFKAIVVICLPIFLVSCATGYQPLNDSSGYWDEQIEPTANRFTIGYDGNKWHSDPVNQKRKNHGSDLTQVSRSCLGKWI